jgi:hypothetical protein
MKKLVLVTATALLATVSFAQDKNPQPSTAPLPEARVIVCQEDIRKLRVEIKTTVEKNKFTPADMTKIKNEDQKLDLEYKKAQSDGLTYAECMKSLNGFKLELETIKKMIQGSPVRPQDDHSNIKPPAGK